MISLRIEVALAAKPETTVPQVLDVLRKAVEPLRDPSEPRTPWLKVKLSTPEGNGRA